MSSVSKPVADGEGLADAAARLGADRDVLQVRVGRAEPAGGRDGLGVRGVDAAVGRDGLLQSLDRLPQPGDVAVGQQVLEERVLGLREQPLQRLGVGGVAGLGALGLRHAELVEQHDLQLLGRAEVHLPADDVVRLLRGAEHPLGELGVERVEVVAVDGDAGGLHAEQDVDQRELDVAQQRQRRLRSSSDSRTPQSSSAALARWTATSAPPSSSKDSWPESSPADTSSRCR